MADIFDITRREFIRTSALLTAGTALAHAAELPQEAAAAHPSAPVFPYGAVYFRKTLTMAGVAQQVTIDDHSVQARLQQGAGGSYLWVTLAGHSKRQGWAYTELPIGRRYLGETNRCDERPASHGKCWRTGCGSDCFAIECSA